MNEENMAPQTLKSKAEVESYISNLEIEEAILCGNLWFEIKNKISALVKNQISQTMKFENEKVIVEREDAVRKVKDEEIKMLKEDILAKDLILEKIILEKENEKRLAEELLKIKNDEIKQYQAFMVSNKALMFENEKVIAKREAAIRIAKDEEIKLLKENILAKDVVILENEKEKRLTKELLKIKNDEIKQYQATLIKNEEVITAIRTNLDLKQDKVQKINQFPEDSQMNITQRLNENQNKRIRLLRKENDQPSIISSSNVIHSDMEENSSESIRQDITSLNQINSSSNLLASSQSNMGERTAENIKYTATLNTTFTIDTNPLETNSKEKVNLSDKKKKKRKPIKRLTHAKSKKKNCVNSMPIRYGMMKSIIDKRVHKGIIQYRVHWDSAEEPFSWEPKELLDKDAPEFIERLERAQKEIDDPGRRYCICQGIDNGDHMIQCITCQSWFHTTCVEINAMQITKEEMLTTRWRCSSCNSKEINDIVDLAIEGGM